MGRGSDLLPASNAFFVVGYDSAGLYVNGRGVDTIRAKIAHQKRPNEWSDSRACRMAKRCARRVGCIPLLGEVQPYAF